MNGDLISRSALHSMVCLDSSRGTYGEFTDGSEVSFTANEVHAMINEAPAVDAVEVVRCKDCKHSRELNEHEWNYLVEDVRICTHPDCSDDCWFATWSDHWCRYGERRAE